MGREIRRVPADWEHPTNNLGHFQPLFDRDYENESKEWWEEATKWHAGDVSESDKEYREKYPWYWEWGSNPPDKEYYRPAWTEEEATHYQAYETVSEGTPKSPVFKTLAEMAAWMVLPIDWSLPYNAGAKDWQCMQGRTPEQAESFTGHGYAPSLVIADGRMMDGVTAGPVVLKK